MAFVQAVRTALFYLVFISQTAVIAIILGIIGLAVRRPTAFGWALARYWCWSNLQLLRWLTGVKTRVSGEENIPPGGCIIASKHQSDWDIFAIFPHTGQPAYIVKKELMRVPFFGWAARSLNCIEIDREKGSAAIPAMMRQAKDAIARGSRIVIYPEGTRRPPLAPAQYRQGIVRMYVELGVPVVPVALNAGLFWGRNSLVIWPGTAEAKLLPPIEPGLPAQEFAARLRETIESESNNLILNAAREGLKRPLSTEMEHQLAALKTAHGTNNQN